VSRPRDERGLSESVQYAVIFPLLMLVTLGVIQAGIWIHGHSVASRAAAAGVDIARGSTGQAAAARDTATRLANAGGLHDVTVQATRTGATAEVVVTGRAPLILDLGLARITENASAPVERATNP
jgi:Flp pilus assembly protein TadG